VTTKRRRSDDEATTKRRSDEAKNKRIQARFRRFAPKNPVPGKAATIGILANPRYTYFMNEAAHRGAHDGNAEGLRTAKRCAAARSSKLGLASSRVPGFTALHRKAVKRAI